MEKKKYLNRLIIFTVVLFAITMISSEHIRAASPMKPITLMANGAQFAPFSVEGRGLKFFGDQVEKRTNGLIKFTYVWSNALTKSGEEVDAVNTGLCDIVNLVPGFYPKKFYLQSVNKGVAFVLPPDLNIRAEVLRKIYKQVPALEQELEKSGLKYLWGQPSAEFNIESRMPINKLDDLKGKKIAVTGINMTLIEAVGARAVPAPASERAAMIQTGVVDGSLLPLTVSFPFKIYEFARHCLDPDFGFSGWSILIVIRKKLWDTFPRDVQEAVEQAGSSALDNQAKMVTETLAKNTEAMKAAGVNFHVFSEEDRARWAELLGSFGPAKWVQDGEAIGLGPAAREGMKTYLDLCKEVSKKSGYKWVKEWKIP